MEQKANNLKEVLTHIKKEGFPSTEEMRLQMEANQEAGVRQDIESKVTEYKTLFSKFYAGTASDEEISRMTDLSKELNKRIKETVIYQKDKNEIINSQIDSLGENIRAIDQKIEPLAETWRDFERQIYSVNSSQGYVGPIAIEEQKRKIKGLKEDRDTDPRIIEMRSLETKKHEMLKEISSLHREQYENSLNELKSEISGLSDKAYKDLDSLTKEHIDPLTAHGMTFKAAKESLDSKFSYLFDNLEDKINTYERVQGDIEKFLADKDRGHDIERLKDQLKSAERFK